MRVVHFSKDHYTVQDLVTSKLKSYHITQLKEFKYDEMDVDPAAVAAAEQMEFLVKRILDHRGNSTRRTDYEFLVKWTGYDNNENTWEPWESVRDNQQLLIYLYQHNLRAFMTKVQKQEIAQLLANNNNA